MTRRRLLTGSLAALAQAKTEIDVFDIHCHPPFPSHSEATILSHQRALGIRTSVLLPINSASAHTLVPSFNIARTSATRMQTAYPGEFLAFTIADPRKSDCARSLTRDLAAGAHGIGELEFPLDCDSPRMDALYKTAEEFRAPVLMHFEHGAASKGFERFYKVVEKYPLVNFIGHAQTFWGNIDLHHRQEQVFPEPDRPVTPGGITDRLLSDYPNVFADLSARSGFNALTRDRDHASRFLERHREKLLFGSDCVHKGVGGPQCWGAQTLRVLAELAPSPEILTKILSTNARTLMGL